MTNQPKKRKDECQFCKSRLCDKQIYRDEEPKYDEVYCDKHCDEAEMACDEILGNGKRIFRHHRSSTGKLSRGSR